MFSLAEKNTFKQDLVGKAIIIIYIHICTYRYLRSLHSLYIYYCLCILQTSIIRSLYHFCEMSSDLSNVILAD